MTHQHAIHLTYDELLRAVVDTTDLERQRRTHLDQCPQCLSAVQRLEKRYTRMGRMARRMAPEPSRSFRVPHGTRPASFRHGKPALAMGLAGALVLFVTLWWSPGFRSGPAPPMQPSPMAAATPEQDRELMQEVDALVANALPPALQELAAVTESNPSEDLIEWVLPSIEEDETPDPQDAWEGVETGLGSGETIHS
jgi:hypothetical protein